MNRWDCVCTSTMLEKKDGMYVRIDDVPSLLEALQMNFKQLNDKIEDLECTLDSLDMAKF